MAEEFGDDVKIELFRAIGFAISNWSQTRAAKNAGALKFWRDGMLRQLELIADGRAEEVTFAALERGYNETEQSTIDAMEKLKAIRDKLGSTKVSDKIDIILNDARFGKHSIRDQIKFIIEHHRTSNVQSMADFVCRDIRALNGEIEALHRLVYE